MRRLGRGRAGARLQEGPTEMNPMEYVLRLHSEALRGGRRLAFGRRHRYAALAGVLLAALAAGEAAGQPGGLFLVVEPAAVFAGPGSQTSPDA